MCVCMKEWVDGCVQSLKTERRDIAVGMLNQQWWWSLALDGGFFFSSMLLHVLCSMYICIMESNIFRRAKSHEYAIYFRFLRKDNAAFSGQKVMSSIGSDRDSRVWGNWVKCSRGSSIEFGKCISSFIIIWMNKVKALNALKISFWFNTQRTK